MKKKIMDIMFTVKEISKTYIHENIKNEKKKYLE